MSEQAGPCSPQCVSVGRTGACWRRCSGDSCPAWLGAEQVKRSPEGKGLSEAPQRIEVSTRVRSVPAESYWHKEFGGKAGCRDQRAQGRAATWIKSPQYCPLDIAKAQDSGSGGRLLFGNRELGYPSTSWSIRRNSGPTGTMSPEPRNNGHEAARPPSTSPLGLHKTLAAA